MELYTWHILGSLRVDEPIIFQTCNSEADINLSRGSPGTEHPYAAHSSRLDQRQTCCCDADLSQSKHTSEANNLHETHSFEGTYQRSILSSEKDYQKHSPKHTASATVIENISCSESLPPVHCHCSEVGIGPPDGCQCRKVNMISPLNYYNHRIKNVSSTQNLEPSLLERGRQKMWTILKKWNFQEDCFGSKVDGDMQATSDSRQLPAGGDNSADRLSNSSSGGSNSSVKYQSSMQDANSFNSSQKLTFSITQILGRNKKVMSPTLAHDAMLETSREESSGMEYWQQSTNSENLSGKVLSVTTSQDVSCDETSYLNANLESVGESVLMHALPEVQEAAESMKIECCHPVSRVCSTHSRTPLGSLHGGGFVTLPNSSLHLGADDSFKSGMLPLDLGSCDKYSLTSCGGDVGAYNNQYCNMSFSDVSLNEKLEYQISTCSADIELYKKAFIMTSGGDETAEKKYDKTTLCAGATEDYKDYTMALASAFDDGIGNKMKTTGGTSRRTHDSNIGLTNLAGQSMNSDCRIKMLGIKICSEKAASSDGLFLEDNASSLGQDKTDGKNTNGDSSLHDVVTCTQLGNSIVGFPVAEGGCKLGSQQEAEPGEDRDVVCIDLPLTNFGFCSGEMTLLL